MRDRNTETTPFTVLIINVGRGVRRDSLGEVSFFLGGEWTGPGGTKVVKATEAVGNKAADLVMGVCGRNKLKGREGSDPAGRIHCHGTSIIYALFAKIFLEHYLNHVAAAFAHTQPC